MEDFEAQKRRDNWKIAGGCILRNIAATIMCFVMFASIYIIAMYLGTSQAGYVVMAVNEDTAETKMLYDFKFETDENGEQKVDTLYEQYEAEYKDMVHWKLVKHPYQTDLSRPADLTVAILTQVLAFLIVFSMLYVKLWDRGDSDRNLVQFDRIRMDRFRGAKIGLLVDLPYAAIWLLLLLGKLEFLPRQMLVLFNLANFHLFSIVNAVTDGATMATEVSWVGVLSLILTLVVFPVMCQISYTLGYRRISIKERLLYKRQAGGNS